MSLSPFQKEKLEYYFNFFDSDGNGQLEKKDLGGFMKKVYEYTGWDENCQYARECYEVHDVFFDTLAEKTNTKAKGHGKITLGMWYNMWQNLLPGAMSMKNFPVWLRLLPKSLFRVIDKNEDNEIDHKELADFYVKFVGIPEENVNSLVSYAMAQMTDNGKWPLTMDSYNQIFANFLIGKTPYGPGRFIFGCFEHVIGKTDFQLIHDAADMCNTESVLKNLKLSPTNPNSIVKLRLIRPS